MILKTYYMPTIKLWTAYFSDNLGRLGESAHGDTEKEAILRLGVEFGRHPSKFTRDLGEYMPAYNAEIESRP